LEWGVNGIVSPKFLAFVSALSRLFCVCGSCWRNLQRCPNPLARFKWAAGRGREGNVERGGWKRKDRKGKRGIAKGVALAPRKKFQRAPTLYFITKLVIDGKLLIEIVSNFTAFIFNTSLAKIFHSKL